MSRTARQLITPGPRALVEQGGFLKLHPGRPVPDAPSSIYYLISRRDVPELHRRPAGVQYFFVAGDAVELVQIDPAGEAFTVIMGVDAKRGEHARTAIVAGAWQGVRLKGPGQWAMLAATIDPGFALDDIEFGRRRDLVRAFARHRALIRRYTRAR